MQYCGAFNPLWLIRSINNQYELTEYEANKRSVGYYLGKSLPFTNKKISLLKGDSLYIFTDGFADQFGGPKGKKYKYQRFKDLLISSQHLDMSRQKEKILEAFNEWKGNLEQVDDVLVIGIRV